MWRSSGPDSKSALRAPRPKWAFARAALASLLFASCSAQVSRKELVSPAHFDVSRHESEELKAHLRDGGVFVFEHWRVDEAGEAVIGVGRRLDRNRAASAPESLRVEIASVALFETRNPRPSAALAPLTLVTAGSIAISVVCLTNPKACFGSCPTFYVTENGAERLHAEGFSASIAPILEATDVDALPIATPSDGRVRITMRNEAYETHVVRHVDLLVVPRPEAGYVFAADGGQFWATSGLVAARQAIAPEGDITELLRAFDGEQRFSLADSSDLACRETIELEFDVPDSGSYGLVLASRQTLLSTFLLYQGLAYMGSQAGRWLSTLERGNAPALESAGKLGELLGGIDVQVPRGADGFETVASTRETGPLATDLRILPLGMLQRGAQSLRLRLTKGHWRLDQVALARLDCLVEPIRLRPKSVERDGRVNMDAHAALCDSTRALTTLPGDKYELTYELPDAHGMYTYFLESRGYYIEWMREAWMREEDSLQALRLFVDPEGMLRELAPRYKQVEPEMETLFWESRYVRAH